MQIAKNILNQREILSSSEFQKNIGPRLQNFVDALNSLNNTFEKIEKEIIDDLTGRTKANPKIQS